MSKVGDKSMNTDHQCVGCLLYVGNVWVGDCRGSLLFQLLRGGLLKSFGGQNGESVNIFTRFVRGWGIRSIN